MNTMADQPNSSFQVTVPATTANLGSGFDVLGMALQVYNHSRVTLSKRTKVRVTGEGAKIVAADERNLIVATARNYWKKEDLPRLDFLLEQENRIPFGRGMGSSAAAIVAGLMIGARLAGRSLNKEELLERAAEIEGHPDNVAAAIYGGATVAYGCNGKFLAHRIEPSRDIGMILLVPQEQLATEKARSVLPSKVARGEAVFNISRACLMTLGLITGEDRLLERGSEDLLHQPQRLSLLPYFAKAQSILQEAGALGFCLSGAGPTTLAFVKVSGAESVLSRVRELLSSESLPLKAVFSLPDSLGARYC